MIAKLQFLCPDCGCSLGASTESEGCAQTIYCPQCYAHIRISWTVKVVSRLDPSITDIRKQLAEEGKQ